LSDEVFKKSGNIWQSSGQRKVGNGTPLVPRMGAAWGYSSVKASVIDKGVEPNFNTQHIQHSTSNSTVEDS